MDATVFSFAHRQGKSMLRAGPILPTPKESKGTSWVDIISHAAPNDQAT